MLCSLLGLSAMPMAQAATINVDGGCSLVDAITAANSDTATGGCSAGSGADTIELESSTTYTLTALLIITLMIAIMVCLRLPVR